MIPNFKIKTADGINKQVLKINTKIQDQIVPVIDGYIKTEHGLQKLFKPDIGLSFSLTITEDLSDSYSGRPSVYSSCMFKITLPDGTIKYDQFDDGSMRGYTQGGVYTFESMVPNTEVYVLAIRGARITSVTFNDISAVTLFGGVTDTNCTTITFNCDITQKHFNETFIDNSLLLNVYINGNVKSDTWISTFEDCVALQNVTVQGTCDIKALESTFASSGMTTLPSMDLSAVDYWTNTFESSDFTDLEGFINTIPNSAIIAGTFKDCSLTVPSNNIITLDFHNMTDAFRYATFSSTDVTININNCKLIDRMFYKTNLQNVVLNAPSVIDMFSTFERSSVVNITINTLATNISDGLMGCSSLVTATFNAPNLIIVSGLFSGCTSLTTIVDLDTSKVETFAETFKNCSSLVTLDIDMSASIYAAYMLQNCTSLECVSNINTANKTIKSAIVVDNCPALTAPSAADVALINSESGLNYINPNAC